MSKNKYNNKQSSGKNNQGKQYKYGSKRTGFKPKVTEVREEPKADSSVKRINLDNARITKVEKDIEKGSKQFGRNDISFWNKNPEMLKAAGSLPFATIAGDPIRTEFKKITEPGVMILYYLPAIGSEEFPEAVNKAAANTFSYLVHANSRNYSYNASDLYLVMQAGAEIFGAIMNAARAYGLTKYSIEQNNYTPNDLISACGFDPLDFRKNLGRVWFEINDWIQETQKIWIPKDYAYLNRTYDLLKTIYKDSEGARAQYYVINRRWFYMYNEKDANTGGFLEPVSNDQGFPIDLSSNLSWDQYSDMVRKMMSRLFEAEDRGIIYGDLLNAYGASNIYTMAPFEASYATVPEYNAEIMTQIENTVLTSVYPCRFLQWQGSLDQASNLGPQLCTQWASQFNGGTATWDAPAIPTSDTLPAEALQQYAEMYAPKHSLLNFHFDGQPSPEAIMTATRFKAGRLVPGSNFEYSVGTKSFNRVTRLVPETVGSEIITKISVMQKNPDIFTNYSGKTQIKQYWRNNNTAGVLQTAYHALRTFSAFDWHPFIYSQDAAVEQLYNTRYVKLDITDIAGDVDNFILVGPQELRKLHQTALYSLYSAKFTG